MEDLRLECRSFCRNILGHSKWQLVQKNKRSKYKEQKSTGILLVDLKPKEAQVLRCCLVRSLFHHLFPRRGGERVREKLLCDYTVVALCSCSGPPEISQVFCKRSSRSSFRSALTGPSHGGVAWQEREKPAVLLPGHTQLGRAEPASTGVTGKLCCLGQCQIRSMELCLVESLLI